MKNILVTGGLGYIGSNAVFQLIDKGYNVFVIDNLSNTFDKYKNNKAHYFVGDFTDIKIWDLILSKNKIDAVMHFAGSISVAESVEKPELYFDNNSRKTNDLLNICKNKGIKYFIFSSTAATYGNPIKVPIEESDLQKPINPYGESKLKSEHEIKASGLHYVIFRYFNVAGADDFLRTGYLSTKPATHIIPVVNEVALGKRDVLKIFGNDYNTKDGTAIRDYVHVSDLVEAHILGMEYLFKGGKSEIFNLGSKSGYSVKEVLDTANATLHKQIPFVYEKRRAGDPEILIASSDKARNILHWVPKRNLSQMIKSDYEWKIKLNK